MKKITTISLLLLFFSVKVKAQLPPNFWTQTHAQPSQSGNTCVVFHEASKSLLIGTLNGAIYQSSDSGSTWQQRVTLTDSAITLITKGSRGELFAIAKNVFLSSLDSGKTWSRKVLPTIYDATDIITINTRILVATASFDEVSPGVIDYKGDGILGSDDGGKTWNKLNTGITYRKAITHLAFNSYDVVFASMASLDGLGGGLYFSTDAGDSWVRMPKITYRVANDLLEVKKVYEVHCLEIDNDDTLHVSYEGAGENFAMSGNIKVNVNDVFWEQPGDQERVLDLGFDWDNKPYYSFYATRMNNHRYVSLHTPNSTSMGGPYFSIGNSPTWQRIPSGILPTNNSYLQTLFAETNWGRVYAVHVTDPRVYFTDTSVFNMPSGLHEKSSYKTCVFSPNPAANYTSTELPVTAPVKDVELVSADGKRVYASWHMIGGQLKINTQMLENGLYMVLINTGVDLYTSRLVILK